MKPTIQLFALMFLMSCSISKKESRTPLKLELESIDKAYLKKELQGSDSIVLSQDQIELLVNEWNNAEPSGPRKMMPKHWITLQLNNDSTRRFRVSGKFIKEREDWSFSMSDSTFIESFWKQAYSFQTPEDYTPLTFLTIASKDVSLSSTPSLPTMSFIEEFPIDWVKEEHLEALFQLIHSKKECGCFVNPLAYTIPMVKAETGGFASIFLKAFKDGEIVDLGLDTCPKVDEELNAELTTWWNERKQ